MVSPEALQMGSRLDEHHAPETNRRMSVCRRCGARTDGPKGHHIPDEPQPGRVLQWLDAQSLSSGIDRARSLSKQLMAPGIGMRMAAGAATVVRLKSRRHDPKNCRHPIGNRMRIGTICDLCGKDPV